MTNALWFLAVGGLLLFMGLTSSILKRSPFTASIVYLAAGVLAGPSLLDFYRFNPFAESRLLEMLTEVAVLISLFAAGVKMPTPFSGKRWRLPILLATLAMVITVGLVAGYAWYVLGLPLGVAILLGGILAPTDSVLASDVRVRHPEEHKRLRFTLSCEAGMNDGSAFPFVMLGLGLTGLYDIGEFGLRWLWHDVLWATVGGLAIGVIGGTLLGRLGWKLRRDPYRHELMDDFIGLGLIGVVYGLSVVVEAWGFLAVFAAAVALRVTEQKLASAATTFSPDATVTGTTLADVRNEVVPLVETTPDPETEPEHTVSEGSLVFKEHLERLSIVLMILLLGGALFKDSWSWQAVGLALFLFLIARPVAVALCYTGTKVPWRMRLLTGWFGMRGIGSLYYLMFAIQHGLDETTSLQLIQLTLIVLTLSILLHGISIKPLTSRIRN